MNTIDDQKPTEGTTTPTPPHAATESCTTTVAASSAVTLSPDEEQWQKDRAMADAQDAAWDRYLHPVRTHMDKIVEDAFHAISEHMSLRAGGNLKSAIISTEDCQVYEVTFSAVALKADSALARAVIAEELKIAENRAKELRHMLDSYQAQ